jgi:tetratricopeptide (TPR) repeat protein
LGALAALAAAWTIRGRSRAPLAAALCFIGALFPVLGFFNVYPFVFSFVADHFQYVPSLAIIAAAAAGLTVLAERVAPRARWVYPTSCMALLGTLAAMTWRQSRTYSDTQTLFETTLARNPGCYLCLNTLGMVEYESGRLAEAIERYERALSIKPNSAEAHNNLGNALVKTGRVSDAIGHYEQALRTAPNYVLAYNNLGGALLFLGRLSEAREQYEAALRIMPDYEPARRNLSILETLQEGAAVSPSLDLATGSGRASPGRRPSPR